MSILIDKLLKEADTSATTQAKDLKWYIPKPPEPPKDRILREDGKRLIPPKNYR